MNPYLNELNNQMTQQAQPTLDEQTAMVQETFDLHLIKLRTMRIKSFELTETLATKNYRRGKHLVLDDMSKAGLQEDFSRFRENAFSVENLSNNYSNIVQYSPLASEAMIKGGWGKRYAFELTLVTTNESPIQGMGCTVEETVISGYTYGADKTLQGTLDPNTEFIVDSVSIYQNNVLSEAYNVLSNPYGTTIEFDYEKMEIMGKHEKLYSIRPTDLSLDFMASGMNGDNAVVSTIDTKPIESKSEHNNPIESLGTTLTNISLAHDYGMKEEDRYRVGARAATYVSEPKLVMNTFFNWLSKRMFDSTSSFTYNTLVELFNEIGINGERYVDDNMLLVETNANVASNLYDADENSGESILDTTAHMFVDALQPIMKKFAITEMHITVSNMNIGNNVVVDLINDHLMFSRDGMNPVTVFQAIVSMVQTTVFPLVSQGRDIGLGILINKMGARVEVTVGGIGTKVSSFSTYAYSTMSPVIANYDEQTTASNNVKTLSEAIINI
jgi:hypothetical protein